MDRMDPMNKATAEVVRAYIRTKGMTQEAVRTRAGITRTPWRNRMAGKRAFLTPELVRIARALGIKPGQIVDPVAEQQP